MAGRDLDTVTERPDRMPAPVPAPVQLGQMTAVEQARAVAEVQAAVVVAQQVPRDMGRVEADVRHACGLLGLANRAFYSVPNRGTGLSVHLLRELARIFGNVQYGVHELRRDDEQHISEVQAFAWDVQQNTRSTRTLIIPHARMVKPKGAARAQREPLSDLSDIYLNNQNVGARAVRECISTVLPAWLTDLAEDLCRKTLEDGEGIALPVRIDTIVDRFAELGVTLAQLEARVGRKRSSWTPFDVVQLGVVGRSITRGETTRELEFPQQRVTADEVQQQNGAGAAVNADTGEVTPPGQALPPVPYDPNAEPVGWEPQP